MSFDIDPINALISSTSSPQAVDQNPCSGRKFSFESVGSKLTPLVEQEEIAPEEKKETKSTFSAEKEEVSAEKEEVKSKVPADIGKEEIKPQVLTDAGREEIESQILADAGTEEIESTLPIEKDKVKSALPAVTCKEQIKSTLSTEKESVKWAPPEEERNTSMAKKVVRFFNPEP